MTQPDFLQKPLTAMTTEEWESLCDGCGLCCQIGVEDEDTGEIALSNVMPGIPPLYGLRSPPEKRCGLRESHPGKREGAGLAAHYLRLPAGGVGGALTTLAPAHLWGCKARPHARAVDERQPHQRR